MNISIELNENNDLSRLSEVAKSRIEYVEGETLDEAFKRILSSKSISNLDRQRINSVRTALLNETIVREQSKVTKKLTKAEVLRLHKRLLEVEAQKTLEKMKREMPANYILVDTETKLNEAVETLSKEDVIVFDVETTGVDIWSDEIVGHVLSAVEADKHYYFAVKHDTEERQLDADYVLSNLKSIYENEAMKIAHNAKFDLHMLQNVGVDVRGELWDTQEAMRMLNENEDTYALKPLVSKYLNIPSLKYEQLFGKKGFNAVRDLQIATSYAAKDGDITYKLYKFQHEHLRKIESVYEYVKNVEMPLIKVVMHLERNGFVIDTEYAKKYEAELVAERDALELKIKSVLGDVNLNSPTQLKPALSLYTGKELKDTDAKKTLKPLAKEFEVVADLLQYKELAKLIGTYVSKLPQLTREKTGRLMATYNQNGAKTGRFSSSGGVNLQNQSPEARKLFVAPPGKVLIGADFKAQEIRCVAALSQEPVLLNAFKEKRDPYAMMASNFYKKPYGEVYKNADGSDTKERKQMKVVWLATLYGMSSVSLAQMLNTDKSSAEALQNDLFASMPKLKRWIDGTKDFTSAAGFVWMDKRQRKRRLPEAKMSRCEIPYDRYYDAEFEQQRLHNASINRALRQGPNAVVQGSSAIQTKVTLLKMHQECAKRSAWKLWCTVHDEILVELPEDFTLEDAKVIEDVMLNAYTFENVENGTDLEVMKRWSDGMTVEDWFAKKGGTAQ